MYQLLIVDDQPDLVEDLATNINWKSIAVSSVYQAFSATEALDIMKMTQIDVVITDIRMPGLSGLDLIEAIKQSWSHIKCILLSGYNDFQYAQRALQFQASDYLLKPVEDEELLTAVKKAIDEIERHWLEVSSHTKAVDSIKANLPILRSHLLHTLLHKRLPDGQLKNRLAMVDLALEWNCPCYMLLMRMEDYFYEQSEEDSSLLEYAICNIAEELFADRCQLWYTKDSYSYYTFLIFPNETIQVSAQLLTEMIEQKVSQLQHYVKLYLKGTISIVLSTPFTFPVHITAAYDQLLQSFRQRIGSERDFLFTIHESYQPTLSDSEYISQLYAPPLLNHLLEIGQWEVLENKLEAIYQELEQQNNDSYEHILEAYYCIASALSYAIHKNKLRMTDCLGTEFNQMLQGPNFHTIAQLRAWVSEAIGAYKQSIKERTEHSKTGIIQKVQEYAVQHLADVSLQAIADHVFLNASYLSKLYKLETSEGISEYISRLRLEKAAHQLRNTNDKIYEISLQVGYSKTSYFIKVFKERYGRTPQEYRDQ